MSVLDELERLEKAATPGPWKYDANDHGEYTGIVMSGENIAVCEVSDDYNFFGEHEDAELIAASRNALPALLRLARAAERACRVCATREYGGACNDCELKSARDDLSDLGVEV